MSLVTDGTLKSGESRASFAYSKWEKNLFAESFFFCIFIEIETGWQISAELCNSLR